MSAVIDHLGSALVGARFQKIDAHPVARAADVRRIDAEAPQFTDRALANIIVRQRADKGCIKAVIAKRDSDIRLAATKTGFNIGDTASTALNVERVRANRFTISYGATLEHEWGQGTYVQLRASGQHHLGDTQTVLASQFTSVSNGGLNFTTAGSRVNDQYLIEGNIWHRFGNGWTIAAEGQGQFGDLAGYTGRIRLTKAF